MARRGERHTLPVVDTPNEDEGSGVAPSIRFRRLSGRNDDRVGAGPRRVRAGRRGRGHAWRAWSRGAALGAWRRVDEEVLEADGRRHRAVGPVDAALAVDAPRLDPGRWGPRLATLGRTPAHDPAP